MKIVLVSFIAAFLLANQMQRMTTAKREINRDEYVVLLHGLARTSRSMGKLEKRLSGIGYTVKNLNYPSTRYPIEYLADEVLGPALQRYVTQSTSKVHFVTHSAGCIVVRYYLKYHPVQNLGRVVMLSPPNKGSELVDRLKNNASFRKYHGPAGLELGTDAESIPLALGPVDFELGVIAGNRSFNPLASRIIPGPDDGSVSVERAKVEGMKDFLVVPCSHTFIMRNRRVIDQVIAFLESGEFKRDE